MRPRVARGDAGSVLPSRLQQPGALDVLVGVVEALLHAIEQHLHLIGLDDERRAEREPLARARAQYHAMVLARLLAPRGDLRAEVLLRRLVASKLHGTDEPHAVRITHDRVIAQR